MEVSKIYDFNNFKSNNTFDFKIIPIAIACYCFGNIGAFVVFYFQEVPVID